MAIVAMAIPATLSAQTAIPAVPQVSKTAQQAIISITKVEGDGHWYIYYRTDRQKSFQVRKMNTAMPGKATYHLPTGMLYGRNVDYFIVKKTAANTSRTPVYTVVDANTNPIPEIYFNEGLPIEDAEDQANPASDPFLSFSGSLSRTDRLYQKEEDASIAHSTNGNLRIFRNINDENYQFDFDSSFSYASPQAAKESAVNLASLMIRFRSGNHQVAIGDLAIAQSEYSAPALNRRGINYELSGQKLYFSAFLTNSQQKSGFEGFGIPPAEANIIGAVIGTNVGPNLKIRGLVLAGQDDLNLGRILAYEENPIRAGNIFSLWGDLNLWESHLQLTGEYAHSSFGTSALSEADISKKKDNAWRSGLTFNYGIINASATYRRIGENFNSIANPFMQNDRGGIEGNLGLTFKTLSLSISYSDQQSFLKTLAQDGQHEKRISTTIGWQIGSHWRIGSDFSLDNLEYNSKTALPSSTPLMETMNFNETFSYTSENNSFSLTFGKIKSGSYVSAFSGQLSCSLRFGQFMSLSPLFSYQKNKDPITRSDASITNMYISSEITFVPQWFTFICSGSYTRNAGDSFASTAIAVNANLNFFMAKLFKDKIQPLLAAKAQFQSDQAAAVRTTNGSFWLQLDLSL